MLMGFLDIATCEMVAGWALDTERPGDILTIRVVVNGEERWRGTADRPRADLERKHGNGRHGFRFAFEPPLPLGQLCEILVCLAQNDQILTTRMVLPAQNGQDKAGGLRPVFVSYIGRSGSTMMMRMLGTAPAVVVAGARTVLYGGRPVMSVPTAIYVTPRSSSPLMEQSPDRSIARLIAAYNFMSSA